MSKLGFKEITEQNWREPDPVLNAFGLQPASGEEWLERILEPKLMDSVPQDVQALFEVARGVLVYGYFFYPLYTLGAEQLFRVADAGATHKCNSEGATSVDTFYKRVKWLADHNIIPQADVPHWDALRHLRNYSSHPEVLTLGVPRDAIYALHDVAEKINALFNGSS